MADRTLTTASFLFSYGWARFMGAGFFGVEKTRGMEWVGPGEGPIVPERAGALIDFINGRPFCMERKDVKSW